MDEAIENSIPNRRVQETGESTDSKSGRYIFRSFFQEDLDRVKAYQDTEAYQKAMRKRSLWTEPLFGVSIGGKST